ncbi:MAG: hypothetical protein N2490_08790 [Ignavibacteria bacterium]|nr:hypothetical protein [Ignavibacteria bacterium]
MIRKGRRQQGTPYLIISGKCHRLKRVLFNERTITEDWLHKFIFEYPEVLPIDEIDSSYAPLIPIGREIPTSVGSIDNLYISPDGYLTLVETKLWRNPEAKREVVGQILDYAKELTTWTFSKLNESVKKSNETLHSSSKGIVEIMKDFDLIEEDYEQIIIDNIERNLKRGRMLLLIVGDGIRESVEEMVEYLQNSAQLQFTLGLIELQLYRNPNDENGLIVIPNLITRTREIIRAIVKIENNVSNASITVETDFTEDKPKTNYSRITLTEEDFFEQLLQNTDSESVNVARKILEISREKGYIIDWLASSFVVKLPDPFGSGQKITLYITTRKGEFYICYSSMQLEKIGLDKQLSYDFTQRTAKLFGLKVHHKLKHSWDRTITLKELKNKLDDFMREVDIFVKNINENSEKVSL